MNDGKNAYTIGAKIRDLRLKNGLTQEELATRAELTKGYISQLENDLTSPSIATLIDILTLLGTDLSKFFSDSQDNQTVFTPDDFFVKKTDTETVTWIVPTAQKNLIEPLMIELEKGAKTDDDFPHEGEEFGYVLSGRVRVIIGERESVAEQGDSFYYIADRKHRLENAFDGKSTVLWVSCPPTF